MKIVTHNGTYHADDVFAVATLLLVYSEAEVIRSRDEGVIKSSDIAVDVGGVYDPYAKRFDHHQAEGGGVRSNGVPYASFGLVWKEYGEVLTGNKDSSVIIEEKLVMPIDGPDNGVSVSQPVFGELSEYTISDFLQSYQDYSSTDESYLYQVFMNVVGVAKELIKREIMNANHKVASVAKVRQIVERSGDSQIIVFEENLPWKSVLVPVPHILYIVGPRPDGRWSVVAVPKSLNSFELKKPLPAEWGSKTDEELREVTGVNDAVFCHKALFMAVALSKEGAIELAEKALNQ
jgi:uncharacterized UPF0160 family protein